MASFVKIFILCSSAFILLTQVEGNRLHKRGVPKDDVTAYDLVENDESEQMEYSNQMFRNGEERGIMNIFRPYPQQPLIQVNPPLALPETPPIAGGLPVPSTYPVNSNRPNFLNLFTNPFTMNNNANLGVNLGWLNRAFEKCSKIDPRQITAIFPTTTNNLREPKMYYFENSTSAQKTWFGAQEWCTSKGMSLVSVNDANENLVLQEKIKQITAGNPSPYWIGLNDLDGILPFTSIGDSTAQFTDWSTAAEPVTDPGCVAYAADTIKMVTADCLADATIKARYICEVSDECTALFMSRYPTQRPKNSGGLSALFPGGK